MTIDNRPAQADTEYPRTRVQRLSNGQTVLVALDDSGLPLEAVAIDAIEPRARVMLEALRRAFLMAAHAIGDYLGMERK